MKLMYPAIVSGETPSISVAVPDLDDCRVCGSTISEALLAVTDAAAQGVIARLERGERYPVSTPLDEITVEGDNAFINPIAFDLTEYMSTHPVSLERREVELRRCILTNAARYRIDLSNALRDALMHLFEEAPSSETYAKSRISSTHDFEPEPDDEYAKYLTQAVPRGLNYDVKVAYPVKIYPDRDGKMYLVEIPDLDDQCTVGVDIADAIVMAIDMISGCVLDLIEEGKPLPTARRLDEVTTDRAGGLTLMIAADIGRYAEQWSGQLVKVATDIPSWLARYADSNEIDLSKLLTIVLSEMIDMKRDREDEESDFELPEEYVEKVFENLGIDPALVHEIDSD